MDRETQRRLLEIDDRVTKVEQRINNIPVRFAAGGGGGFGGGGFDIDEVETLPPVPTVSFRFVIGVTSRNLWFSASSLTRWYPMIFASGNLDTGFGFGAPGDNA